MGRKRKSGLDVCPLDVNMLSDIRMRRLIRRHQGDAIAVYTALLCLVYRDGYYVEFNDDVRFFLSEQTGIEECKVIEIVEDAVACDLFDAAVFGAHGVLTSQEIQDTYLEECGRTKRKTVLVKYVISSEETPICSEEIVINSEEISINSEEMPKTSESIGVNAEEKTVSSEEMHITEEPCIHVPAVRDFIVPVVEVLDTQEDNLELFNTPSVRDNINQEKEKTRQKEKEVGLALPYCSAHFVETWELLRSQPKWKKKTISALQMSLNKLGKYPEEFAIILMENAIAGGWQGVVFTWTPDDFRKWQAQQNGGSPRLGNKKPRDIYESNMESMNEAFGLIDGKKYGT